MQHNTLATYLRLALTGLSLRVQGGNSESARMKRRLNVGSTRHLHAATLSWHNGCENHYRFLSTKERRADEPRQRCMQFSAIYSPLHKAHRIEKVIRLNLALRKASARRDAGSASVRGERYGNPATSLIFYGANSRAQHLRARLIAQSTARACTGL